MGKDPFYKRKELLKEILNKNLEKRITKFMIIMECGVVWIGNMDNEKGRYQKIRVYRHVDMT